MHEAVAKAVANTPAEAQLLAVVDKIEHMNAMAPYLEEYNFKMVHAEQSQKNLDANGFAHVKAISKKERRNIYDKIAAGHIMRVLSTGIYRQGVNFKNLRVLINTEGMGSEIIAGQLPGRASRNIDGKDKAYIVDFCHPWDMILNAKGQKVPGMVLRDDRSREKVYTGLGFDQVWIDSPDDIKIQV
jgi:superfamily II DNA or RNA helicase